LHVEIVASIISTFKIIISLFSLVITIRKITTGIVMEDASIKLDSAMENVLLTLKSVEQIYVFQRIVG